MPLHSKSNQILDKQGAPVNANNSVWTPFRGGMHEVTTLLSSVSQLGFALRFCNPTSAVIVSIITHELCHIWTSRHNVGAWRNNAKCQDI